MKMNKWFAVLLTVLFLTPFFPARGEDAPAFSIDENAILRGMNRSWLQGYAPSVSRGKWILILPVRAGAAVGSIHAEMIVNNERMTPFKSQTMAVEAREEGKGVWGVRFALALLPDQKNADYPCRIRITGTDRSGGTLSAELPYTIRIRGSKENLEKARISITGVQADLSVGEEGEVRVTLANPCSATDIEDLELKISDASGHILPRDAETMKIGNLAIGESVTVNYPVTVLEKASVAPHVLKLDLSWTAAGQAAACSENNTVPVRQEIRLEQGGLKMAPSVAAGDSVTMSLPVMNMGRADVVNVMATVILPGVTERQSVLVGTIQPGETKMAQMVLTPAKDTTGEFSGRITVECTDQDGNPASFSVPVNLTVEEPKKTDGLLTDGGETPAERKIPPATIGLAGGCGLLLILLITQGIALRRKIHLLEEANL